MASTGTELAVAPSNPPAAAAAASTAPVAGTGSAGAPAPLSAKTPTKAKIRRDMTNWSAKDVTRLLLKGNATIGRAKALKQLREDPTVVVIEPVPYDGDIVDEAPEKFFDDGFDRVRARLSKFMSPKDYAKTVSDVNTMLTQKTVGPLQTILCAAFAPCTCFATVAYLHTKSTKALEDVEMFLDTSVNPNLPDKRAQFEWVRMDYGPYFIVRLSEGVPVEASVEDVKRTETESKPSTQTMSEFGSMKSINESSTGSPLAKTATLQSATTISSSTDRLLSPSSPSSPASPNPSTTR